MNKKFEKKNTNKKHRYAFCLNFFAESNKKKPQNKTKSIKINKNSLYFIG